MDRHHFSSLSLRLILKLFSIFTGAIKAKMEFLILPPNLFLLKFFFFPSQWFISHLHSISLPKTMVMTNKWILPPTYIPKLTTCLHFHHKHLCSGHAVAKSRQEVPQWSHLPLSPAVTYTRGPFLNCKLGTLTPLLKIPREFAGYSMTLKNYWEVISVIVVWWLCF